MNLILIFNKSVLTLSVKCRQSKGSVGENILKEKHDKINENRNALDATITLQQNRYSQNV